jgi:hypothetical protein
MPKIHMQYSINWRIDMKAASWESCWSFAPWLKRECEAGSVDTHTQTIVHAIAAPGVIIHFLLAVCVYALLTLRDSSIIHAQSKQVPNTLPASLSRLDRGQSRRQVPCARLSLHTPCIPRRSCSSPDKSTASQGMMVCAINPRP